jgi:hypothetical protein
VTVIAPRIDPRLLAALVRLERRRSGPIAETHRRLGEVADFLGLPRPSYERVRVLVNEHRRNALNPGPGEMLLDIAFRKRPPQAVLDALAP